MSYFTTSKYERMMTQIPRPRQTIHPPRLAPGHLCYGCGRYRQCYGIGCVHPCYREVQKKAVTV